MTLNSTHFAILAITVITSISIIYDVDLSEIEPIIGIIGVYAGIREYKRVKDKNHSGV